MSFRFLIFNPCFHLSNFIRCSFCLPIMGTCLPNKVFAVIIRVWVIIIWYRFFRSNIFCRFVEAQIQLVIIKGSILASLTLNVFKEIVVVSIIESIPEIICIDNRNSGLARVIDQFGALVNWGSILWLIFNVNWSPSSWPESMVIKWGINLQVGSTVKWTPTILSEIRPWQGLMMSLGRL